MKYHLPRSLFPLPPSPFWQLFPALDNKSWGNELLELKKSQDKLHFNYWERQSENKFRAKFQEDSVLFCFVGIYSPLHVFIYTEVVTLLNFIHFLKQESKCWPVSSAPLATGNGIVPQTLVCKCSTTQRWIYLPSMLDCRPLWTTAWEALHLGKRSSIDWETHF